MTTTKQVAKVSVLQDRTIVEVDSSQQASSAAYYPPAYSTTYIKATTYVNTSYYPWFSINPAKSVIGNDTNNSWLSSAGSRTNQRFHIDLGAIKRLVSFTYHNYHDEGLLTDIGAKTYTIWGSNTPAAFADLTYNTDTNWTQLTTSQATLDRHTASNVSDEKSISVGTLEGYRYYAFKFQDNWGHGAYIGIRHLTLMVGNYVVYDSNLDVNVDQDLLITAMVGSKTSILYI